MENGRDLQRRLESKRLRYWLMTAAGRISDIGRTIIVIGSLTLGVVFNIPWLEGPLKKVGFENATEVTLSIVIFLLVAIFYEVRSPSSSRETGPHYPRHFPDAMDVYPFLVERMNMIKRREDKTLDVLGMTLYTAWPTITFWLNRAELDNWTIRLTAVSPQQEDLKRVVPQSWFSESTANLSDAARVARLSRILQKGLRIETHAYDFAPALHGFRLGNGDLFWSLLEWDREGKICRDAYSYEFVPREDDTASAAAIRHVFDSWFTRARQHEWTTQGTAEPSSGIDPVRAFRPPSTSEG